MSVTSARYGTKKEGRGKDAKRPRARRSVSHRTQSMQDPGDWRKKAYRRVDRETALVPILRWLRMIQQLRKAAEWGPFKNVRIPWQYGQVRDYPKSIVEKRC